MLNYCLSCDSYYEEALQIVTYVGPRICDVCAEHLHSCCRQCDLHYPSRAEGADPVWCPDCLSSQTEGDEGDV